MQVIYCIDTSGWTNLARNYRPANFPGLWGDIKKLTSNNRIIAPEEVYKEFEKQDDYLFSWAKRHKGVFVPLDYEQATLVSEIEGKFPKISEQLKNRDRPFADPFVVAVAVITKRNRYLEGYDCVVVSGETLATRKKVKIPEICAALRIEHFSVADVITKEGWVYTKQ